MRWATTVFWTDPLYRCPYKVFVVYKGRHGRGGGLAELAEISARQTGINYTGKTVLKLDSLSNH